MSTIAQPHVTTSTSSIVEKNGYHGELTRNELEELAELAARRLLCVGKDDAFAMLDRGDLRGTLAEGTFGSLRWLLEAA